MDPDTDIGGPNHRFPATNESAIVRIRSGDEQTRERAFESILTSYWKPAYKYIRWKWHASNEDAKDLTQSFFAVAFEKNYFSAYDPAKASFRTFIRTCLDGFVSNQQKSDKRLKRGGLSEHLVLDFMSAEAELALQYTAQDLTPEDFFHREWVRSFFTVAVERLRERLSSSNRHLHLKLFEIYDLNDDEPDERVSYAKLAQQFNLDAATVNNYLAAARREFRKIVLEKLAEITATEEEFRSEARSLLGLELK
ncbi:MAG TPA: sigma-70 family RNA polymerase sigma factor [Pyrinomonadaceae bacterium]|nr:sigma-70 family RNA polymerase sigma factor [Pyrinomonadaceae bacterium]